MCCDKYFGRMLRESRRGEWIVVQRFVRSNFECEGLVENVAYGLGIIAVKRAVNTCRLSGNGLFESFVERAGLEDEQAMAHPPAEA